MSGQSGQYPGTISRSGEERRWRENTVAQSARSVRHRMTHRTLPSGTYLEDIGSRARSRFRHPFLCSRVAAEGGMALAVEPGTFNGVYPIMGGQMIYQRPLMGLPEGSAFVYLKVQYALASANSFVYGADFAGASIVVQSSEILVSPTGPNDTGEYHILLASFMNGTKTGQPVISSLSGEVCGTQDGSGMASLDFGAA